MKITVRPAQTEHFALLRAIELAAFETLREAGAGTGQAVASSLEDFSDFSRNGLLLAAFKPDSDPVGFVAGKFENQWLHIAEIDVHPDWQRKGIGGLLMNTILSAGKQRGMSGATLTTDNIATFNARYYTSLGFEIVEGHFRPLHLDNLIADEIAAGFDASRRVAMRIVY